MYHGIHAVSTGILSIFALVNLWKNTFPCFSGVCKSCGIGVCEDRSDTNIYKSFFRWTGTCCTYYIILFIN